MSDDTSRRDPLSGWCGCQYDASGKVFVDHCVCLDDYDPDEAGSFQELFIAYERLRADLECERGWNRALTEAVENRNAEIRRLQAVERQAFLCLEESKKDPQAAWNRFDTAMRDLHRALDELDDGDDVG